VLYAHQINHPASLGCEDDILLPEDINTLYNPEVAFKRKNTFIVLSVASEINTVLEPQLTSSPDPS